MTKRRTVDKNIGRASVCIWEGVYGVRGWQFVSTFFRSTCFDISRQAPKNWPILTNTKKNALRQQKGVVEILGGGSFPTIGPINL